MPPLGASGGSGDKKTQASVNKVRHPAPAPIKHNTPSLVRVRRPAPRVQPRKTYVPPRRVTSTVGNRPRSTPSNNPGKVQQVQKPLTLEQWLNKDSEYQSQLSQFGKTWADFLADVGVRKARAGTDYELGKKNMADQRTRDLEALKNDYASRGLLQSGLYGERVGQYETDYNKNVADLETQRQRLLQDIGTEQTNFQREQDLEKQRARQAAAQRRTAKL